MENHDWEKIKDGPGEYIASVVLFHIVNAMDGIKDRLESLSKKQMNRCNVELIEPLLKEKWQDLTSEKRNETIRIFHHISEAIRENLTDWFDSLRLEIENLANDGEYSGTYLGSYGYNEGPADFLRNTEEPMNKVSGIIGTLQMAFVKEEEFQGFFFSLEAANDFLEEIKEQIDSARDMMWGKFPKKSE